MADSKLCTRKNLQHIDDYGGRFVTLLPRTRSEDRDFRKYLREGGRVRWRKILVNEQNRRGNAPEDIYYTTADGPGQTVEGYRIIWCRSSQKMEFDDHARESTIQKAEAELYDLNARLNRGKLKQRSAIRMQVDKILRKRCCQGFMKVKIAYRVIVKTQYLRPGRPGKDDPVREVRSRIYRLEVKRNKDALHNEARTDGVFPLVTNLKRNTSKKDVLLIYKYQPYVEKRHALLKNELEVAPVYIKKPLRAAGLIHATFLAMILDALIERTVRQEMMLEGIESLPILPEGRLTETPTTARILEIFSDVCWYEFERGGETVTFPISLSPLQKQLLKLLGMDSSAYV